jgi:hypothetical protein
VRRCLDGGPTYPLIGSGEGAWKGGKGENGRGEGVEMEWREVESESKEMSEE